MRSVVRTIGIVGAVVFLAGRQDAHAQIFETVEFTAPFAFIVGQATMPAGAYTIRPDDDSPNILQITGEHASAFFTTDGAEARATPSQTEIVFKRYGDTYILKDIWIEGSTTGAEAVVAEGERHMSKRAVSSLEQRVPAKRIAASGH